MALALVVLAGFLALAFLPQLWVQRVIARHSGDRPDFPGTGGDWANRIGAPGVANRSTAKPIPRSRASTQSAARATSGLCRESALTLGIRSSSNKAATCSWAGV